MSLPGGGRINPNPCTDEDRAQTLREVVDAVTELVAGGVTDDWKVKSTTNDSTQDFLHDAFSNPIGGGTYVAGTDIVIRNETIGGSGTDQKEQLFIDASASIAAYSGAGTWALCEVAGVATWVDTTTFAGGTGSDDHKVFINATDATGGTVKADYLYDSIYNATAKVMAEDPPVGVAVKDLGSANYNIELFLDSSAITGYTGNTTVYLNLADGEVNWGSLQTVADTIFNESITMDGATYNDTTNVLTITGGSFYTVIQGLTVGAVTPQSTSFTIDNVVPLAGGKDPVNGNPVTAITVDKDPTSEKVSFADNTPVVAVADSGGWRMLVTERYRMIRGQTTAAVLSGASTFTIDNIDVVGSGLDPRSDPASSSESLIVQNVHSDAYDDNAKVVAVYNDEVSAGVDWEAMPKGVAGSSTAKFGKADSGIPALSGTTPGSGTVSIWRWNGSVIEDSGSNETWHNLANSAVLSGKFLASVSIGSRDIVIYEVC